MDVAIVETGNGGDAVLLGNDVQLVFNGENNIYLGLFGGNKEEVSGSRVEGAQAFDYWGNILFDLTSPSVQLNSTTEKAFQEIPLTSAGRVIIENSMKSDLKFMTDFGSVEISTEIVATDRLDTIIKWFLLDGTPVVSSLIFKESPEGDFFLFDFNNDFKV